MHIVSDWRDAWRWFSLQISAVGVALQLAIIKFPQLKDWVGDTVAQYVGLLILCGIIVGRLTRQPPPAAK